MGNWNIGGDYESEAYGVEPTLNRAVGSGSDSNSGRFNIEQSIREFRTGIPALTRGQALQRATISPYATNAVSFPQMQGGFIDVPKGGLNLELEMRTPNLPAPMITPKSVLEKRTVNLGKDGTATGPTYQVTSENQIMDFIGGRINPLKGIIDFDTRTARPLTGGENYQVSSVSGPFGLSTDQIISYSELERRNAEDRARSLGDEYVAPPVVASAPSYRRSLVPMGQYGVGRALDPRSFYNPFGLLG